MAEKRCYYEVLGVAKDASGDVIAQSYRKLAMQYHPDRNPGDEEAVERFKEAAEAFEVLSDEEKRGIYDRYGHAGVERQAGGAPHFHDVGDIFEAFGGIFGDLFGFGRGRGGRARTPRGADIRCDVQVDLFEAAHGVKKEIKFQRAQKCKTCDGTGAKPGTSPETCSYCGGQGSVVQSAGFFSMQTTCPACQGSGKIIRDKCKDCGGDGYILKTKRAEISIPPGIESGMRINLQGQGHPSFQGGRPGDCYCTVHVKPHPLFERKGQHLICQVPISYCQAALGATIQVPTLDGPEDYKIKPGTQSDEVITLHGKGIPSLQHHGRGDLHVQLHVEVPKKLSEEHEELLRKLAEIEQSDVSPKRKSFFEKLKEYFK